ncbi:MFS transporter [Yersinia entomophaga]|uniref:MFS transporter n=1 Tax=Yersinia entomophaga TaxID=935293 RepID=A0ABM6BGQ2_YERET|nr:MULTISPECIES: hypothetical protein [Yersinia]ANI28595.1 MFS transporter [Yersinia entomophaga]
MYFIRNGQPDGRLSRNKPAPEIGTLLGVNEPGWAIGPVVGRIRVSTLGWRWVFLLNLALILLSFAGCRGKVCELLLDTGQQRLDIICLLLLISVLAILLSGINHGGLWGWISGKTLEILLLAARGKRPRSPIGVAGSG